MSRKKSKEACNPGCDPRVYEGRESLTALKGIQMLNLKLALLATTAVGAVTAGGIAYATVGSSSPSAPAKVKAITDAAGKAAHGATSKVPPAPTCLPSTPQGELPKAKNHVMKNHHVVNGQLPKAGLPAVPDASATPANALPKAPAAVPVTPPNALPKAPAGAPAAALRGTPVSPATNLPACLPSVPKPGDQTAQTGQGVTPARPGLPQAPEAKAPSCDTVPPAISERKAQAKDVALPAGMHLASAHAHSITVQSHQVCENVEKFVGGGGSFLTVERLQTPPQVTLQELAGALQMPQGKTVSVGGLQAWQTSLGTGMVWFSDQGYAIAMNGSPDLAGRLALIATQLQHTK